MYLLPTSQIREPLKIRWLQSGTHLAEYFLMKIDPLKSYKGSRHDMKTLKTALFAAVGFATLVGALVLSGLQPQESEGQSFGPQRRSTEPKKCCYYEQAINRRQKDGEIKPVTLRYIVCTIDPECPEITGNLIATWGVENCMDCKNPARRTLSRAPTIIVSPSTTLVTSLQSAFLEDCASPLLSR